MIFNLAIKGIMRRKRQSIMIIIGFALSTALFVSLAILIKSARTSFIKPFPNGADMIIQTEGQPCTWAPVKLPTNLNPISQGIIEQIKKSFYVENAAGILITWVFSGIELQGRETRPGTEFIKTTTNNIPVFIAEAESAVKPLVVTGIDIKHLDLSPIDQADIIQGRLFAGGSKDEAVLDAEFASLLDKKVGDIIKLGEREFKVVGVSSLDRESGFRAQVFIDISSAQSMLGQGEVVDTIFVKLKSATNQKMVEKELRNIVGDPATITTVRDYLFLLSHISQLERIYLVVFFLISVVISISFILKSILSYIGEKLRDIGILKAIGWNGRKIIQLIVYENSLFGIGGGVIGSGVGYLLSKSYKLGKLDLPYFLNPHPPCAFTGTEATFNLSLRPSPDIFLFAIIISSLLGILIGYVVGLRLGHLNPAKTLRSL